MIYYKPVGIFAERNEPCKVVHIRCRDGSEQFNVFVRPKGGDLFTVCAAAWVRRRYERRPPVGRVFHLNFGEDYGHGRWFLIEAYEDHRA